MITNRPMLAVTLWLCALSSGSAQDAPSPPPAESPPPPAASEPPAQPQQPEQNEPRTLEEIFIPSDEIAADEEVTFPVDI